MSGFAFSPLIDLPLAFATLLAFLLHFNSWARGIHREIDVDLRSRLPNAMVRVITLFVGVLLFCWLTNFAFWALFGLILTFGIAIAIASNGGQGSGLILFFATYAIREWSFGFPQIVLHPRSDPSPRHETLDETSDLIGVRGLAITPIRPCGDVALNGQIFPVVSENGQYIETGTDVIICGKRNGRLLAAEYIG